MFVKKIYFSGLFAGETQTTKYSETKNDQKLPVMRKNRVKRGGGGGGEGLKLQFLQCKTDD